MDYDALVESITNEVLQKLQGGSQEGRVLVLGDRHCASTKKLLRHLGPEARLSFFERSMDCESAQRVIVPLLTCRQMADLALGRATDPIAEKVLSLLLSGQEIEVLEFEHKHYEGRAKDALYRLYETYQKTLLSFGLKSFNCSSAKAPYSSKRLISEVDIIEAHKNGIKVLELTERTQLTPLAVDCAKKHGICIQKLERC